MGRAKMVTRTVVGTKIEVMVFENTTNEVTTITQTIGGQFADSAKLFKAAEKAINSDTLKVLKIVTSEPSDKCYGMSEADFLKYAKELDPKTRKLLEADPEAEIETDTSAEDTSEATTEEPKTEKKGRK